MASSSVLFAAFWGMLAAQLVQLEWTTDFPASHPHQIGHDGPWQAVSLRVGGDLGFTVDVWPTDKDLIYIVANTTLGEHSIENLQFSKKLPMWFGNPLEWALYNTTFSSGRGYSELIALSPKTSRPISFNYSIAVFNEPIFTLPDERGYINNVGILGLGSPAVNSPNDGNPIDGKPTLLEQLKQSGEITSRSFGMHMGSAQHSQPGSLVLGGYEQNRALGDIGIFDVDDGGSPHIFLLDVTLDTQVGDSPFNESKIGSIYQGTDNSYMANITKFLGGTKGSALVDLSSAVPYIYLPPGTCETASQYLPVIWDEDIELYIWNQTDPQYDRIVSSSAYLGFIFADRDASNITIKVPFQLLNLTLLPPIVHLPTPYFPCKPLAGESPNRWTLGRAFLQAAFYGVNFETQTTFIGQGPGPNMDISVVRVMRPKDTGIISNPIASFEESWSAYWTVLPKSPNKSQGSKDDLSRAGTEGIIVGSIFGGLILVFGAAITIWNRRRQFTQHFRTVERQNYEENLSLLGAVIELDASPIPLDMSDLLPHECEYTIFAILAKYRSYPFPTQYCIGFAS
ncbi:aspartic peptidase domain-containing protein [Nemania abortiva]|nr:aspartic peptidase domain-containing protein [Nemania abortiva]